MLAFPKTAGSFHNRSKFSQDLGKFVPLMVFFTHRFLIFFLSDALHNISHPGSYQSRYWRTETYGSHVNQTKKVFIRALALQ